MPCFKDLTGLRFNKLLVISREYKKGRNGYASWNCLCACGKKSIVISNELTRNKTKSCGCLRKEGNNKGIYGESSFTSLYNKMVFAAKKRKLIFSLSKEEVRLLTQQTCFYCGTKPLGLLYNKNYYGNYKYNGLDRVDNNKGYILDNVVSCCKICNVAKRNLTIQDFKFWVNKIYEYWGKNDKV